MARVCDLTALLASVLVAGALVSSPARADAERKTCVPMSNNEARIRSLLKRQDKLEHAIQQKRWLYIARHLSYPQPAPGKGSGVGEWQKEMERLWSHGRLVEWEPLSVSQCGALAAVLSRDWVKDDSGEKHLSEGPSWWVWRMGQWYYTEPDTFLRSLPSNGEKREIDWSSEERRFWITKPREDFLLAWETPVGLKNVPPPRKERSLAEDIESYNKDPIGYILRAPSPPPGTQRALRDVVSRYSAAIMKGDEDQVRRFWSPQPRGWASIRDPAFYAIREAARGKKVTSFRIQDIRFRGSVGMAVVTFEIEDQPPRSARETSVVSFWEWDDLAEADDPVWVRTPDIPASRWNSEPGDREPSPLIEPQPPEQERKIR